ncbi:MAG: hypothetical protein IPQ05_23255 [Leptospiraceae bacterium]|nr:hypothetical protein [Leptospiraceae bacterium]
MQGGYLLYSAPNIEKMFIKPISLHEQVPFIDLVNKVTLAREEGKDSKNYEDEIDTLFYKLYGITKSEKKIIEGK